MLDMQQRFLSSSLTNFVSADLDTSWAAKSWDTGFSHLRDRARFQQRQLQEKEQKLLRLYEEQQERQERAVQRGRPGPGAGKTVGAGKVRSMLQCRRELGRDKSYPLEPLPKTQNPSRKQVLYFGGSQQDLHFSEELDYGQSFQVIDDQLLYPDNQDFHLQSFNKKRQFYEEHLSGVSQENLSGSYHKLPNVGVEGSFRMSQKVEPPKMKSFVSGKSTIRAAPARSGLPTRQNLSSSATPARKPTPLPTNKSKTASQSDVPTNGVRNVHVSNVNSGTSSPTRQLTRKPPLSLQAQKTNTTQSVPPVPASRTTVPATRSTAPVRSTPSRPVPSAPPAGLTSCRHCGRNFMPDRVTKHEAICQKSTTKKRKVFDPVKHRVQGTEAEKYVLTGVSARNAQNAEKAKTNQSNWRKKHEEFILNIRAAKQVQDHLNKGGKLSDLPPPPPSDYSDYIQCPHCQRKFNQTAADRHIPKCANMLHNKPRPTPTLRSSSTFRKK